MFNRFAAAGMRSIASKQVEKDEQGEPRLHSNRPRLDTNLFRQTFRRHRDDRSYLLFARVRHLQQPVFLVFVILRRFLIRLDDRPNDHSVGTGFLRRHSIAKIWRSSCIVIAR